MSLTDILCTKCALCCDGSLFADVELSGPAEATRLEIMGLEIDEADSGVGLLSLPCRALKGRRCGIYEHRPKCCRTFECGLLQDVREGNVTVERAQEHIAEALRQIAQVKQSMLELGQSDERLPLKERCAEILAAEASRDPEVNRKRAELEAAMSAVEGLIHKVFLASG